MNDAIIRDGSQLIIECGKLRRDYRYVFCLVVFWLLWTPVTIFVTWLTVTHFEYMLLFCLVFGYAGVILIPLSLWQLFARQMIRVEANGLRIQGTGMTGWTSILIPKDKLFIVTLERYADNSGYNLYIHRQGNFLKSHLIAAFAHSKEKEKIYSELIALLQEHGFLFEARKTQAVWN